MTNPIVEFEGKLNLNVETSEIEVNGKFKLTQEELDKVSGGAARPGEIRIAHLKKGPCSENDAVLEGIGEELAAFSGAPDKIGTAVMSIILSRFAEAAPGEPAERG